MHEEFILAQCQPSIFTHFCQSFGLYACLSINYNIIKNAQLALSGIDICDKTAVPSLKGIEMRIVSKDS